MSSGDQCSIFSLETGARLADEVCARLGLRRGQHEERPFDDGEHKIRPLENVRDRNVFVIQSLYEDEHIGLNDKLCRLLFFLGALRDAGARRVTAVVPYLCYARKDRRTKRRDPLSLRYVAALFEAVGTDQVVTIDVHNPAAFENAFRIPSIALTGAYIFAEAIRRRLGQAKAAVVSPDAGGVKRAEQLRAVLEDQLGEDVGSAFVEKHRSEGLVWGGALAGDIRGKTAVIVDDLVSGGGTLARAARACRDAGADSVLAAASHGLFVKDAGDVLQTAPIDRLFVLDTIPPFRLPPEVVRERLEVLESAPLLATTILRAHEGGDIEALIPEG